MTYPSINNQKYPLPVPTSPGYSPKQANNRGYPRWAPVGPPARQNVYIQVLSGKRYSVLHGSDCTLIYRVYLSGSKSSTAWGVHVRCDVQTSGERCEVQDQCCEVWVFRTGMRCKVGSFSLHVIANSVTTYSLPPHLPYCLICGLALIRSVALALWETGSPGWDTTLVCYLIQGHSWCNWCTFVIMYVSLSIWSAG